MACRISHLIMRKTCPRKSSNVKHYRIYWPNTLMEKKNKNKFQSWNHKFMCVCMHPRHIIKWQIKEGKICDFVKINLMLHLPFNFKYSLSVIRKCLFYVAADNLSLDLLTRFVLSKYSLIYKTKIWQITIIQYRLGTKLKIRHSCSFCATCLD